MQQDALCLTFPALANPTRRAILARLATAETSVSELALPFDMRLLDNARDEERRVFHASFASMDQGVVATFDQ